MKTLIWHLILSFLIGLSQIPTSLAQIVTETKSNTQQDQKMDQYVKSTLEEYKIPGLAAVVLDKDKILGLSAFGKRKKGEAPAIRLEDRFHLGSNTKAMTAFLAAQLVSEAKIKWETKVLDLFPEWKESTKEVYQEITLQELLSHRARIRAFTSGIEFLAVPKLEGTNLEKRRAFSKWLLQLEPVSIDPQKGNTYSNAGYSIASAMLEKVTDKAWEELLEEYIFKPLEIKASYGWPAIADAAQPWGHIQGAAHDPNGDYHLGVLVAPAGDVSMSIKDYAKFLQENLRGLSGEDKLLKSEMIDFLHHANKANSDYGLGWGRAEVKGKNLSYHDGSAGTFYCHTMILKKSGIAIAIVANAADQETVKGMYQLSKKLGKLFVTLE